MLSQLSRISTAEEFCLGHSLVRKGPRFSPVLAKPCQESKRYFGNLGDSWLTQTLFNNSSSNSMSRHDFCELQTKESMLSLFMSIAGGVSWEEVIRPLQEMLGC